MQLNVHVPRDREEVIRALEACAAERGLPKNQIVLDAVAAYVKKSTPRGREPRLRRFDLRIREPLRRGAIYEEALDRVTQHR
jgi:hypothetical protein